MISQKNAQPKADNDIPAVRRVTLRNKRGLHARASNRFAALAQTFNADIRVTSHNDVCCESVVGNSIMELLLLGSACGEDITISATGPEAQDAVAALAAMVERRFGETE